MKVRIIDFVANRGGGLRFAAELITALRRRQPDSTFELVGDRRGVAAYRASLGAGGAGLGFRNVTLPGAHLRALLPLLRLPGARRLAAQHDLGRLWHVDIPDTLLDGCDAVWLPWLHRHRIAWNRCVGVVASFHDATFLRFGDLAKRHPHSLFVESERQITGRWLGSPAQVVCSSRVTRDELVGSFGVAAGRLEVIRVAGDHSHLEVGDTPMPSWPWLARPYLLCPANTALHKNHEVLFKGVATWGARWPLVLVGEGSDLDTPRTRRTLSFAASAGLIRPSRATSLRQLAESVGLVVGKTLHPLGFVAESLYQVLLRHAAAVVVPTLAEGGGSFPVYEAARLGVPVLCSDIPVIREQIEHEGTPVLFFDPSRPQTLTAALEQLEVGYAGLRERARRHAGTWRGRSWDDVADEYWRLIERATSRS